MVLKVEIRTHDGLGRFSKLKINEKVIQSPNLIKTFLIPAYHTYDDGEISPFSNGNNPDITLGYFPALHKFSNFSSENEVLDVLENKNFSH